ncbi:MAG: methylated-DNA--[protein]-cysteine S-methyltransferase [Acidobacteriota bacterium]
MPLAAHVAPHCAQLTLSTPLGDALIARSPRGVTGLWFEGQKDHPGALPHVPVCDDDAVLVSCVQQLHQYWQGQRQCFDLPLDLHGTAFQIEVWRALLEVPCGSLTTYGQLARQLGRPQASRAVGAAVGLNPISVIVPCHRVVGSQGSLTGYAGGLDRKVSLLAQEGLRMRGSRVSMPHTAPLF